MSEDAKPVRERPNGDSFQCVLLNLAVGLPAELLDTAKLRRNAGDDNLAIGMEAVAMRIHEIVLSGRSTRRLCEDFPGGMGMTRGEVIEHLQQLHGWLSDRAEVQRNIIDRLRSSADGPNDAALHAYAVTVSWVLALDGAMGLMGCAKPEGAE